ncbi:4Fe-4S single cluster domain protein [Mycobacterium kansasii]|uniref:4Fe-4S single cluster domain protein n=1 Tax=Mycobacterium kansasii TaxID=1768 RepID=A0A1V3WU98_MYCKA|nr:4Fe-4S single cluster domain protein [Mycobacterium kansasii]
MGGRPVLPRARHVPDAVPEVFRLTDDGYAEAITSDVPTELEAAAREAIECCPEQAIRER